MLLLLLKILLLRLLLLAKRCLAARRRVADATAALEGAVGPAELLGAGAAASHSHPHPSPHHAAPGEGVVVLRRSAIVVLCAECEDRALAEASGRASTIEGGAAATRGAVRLQHGADGG